MNLKKEDRFVAKVIKIGIVKLNNRQIGYLSLIFIFTLVGAGALALWAKSRHTHHVLLVEFEEIGSLKPEIDVFSNGVSIGQVTTVKQIDNRSVVVLDFNEPISILEGTQVYNRNLSLVGDRVVVIELSKEGKPLDTSKPLKGIYERGFSESLHLVQMAVDQVALIKNLLAPQLESTENSPAFYEHFRAIITDLNGLTVQLADLLDRAEPAIFSTLDKGNELGIQTLKISNEIDAHLKEIAQQADPMVASVSKSLAGLHSGMSGLNQSLTHLQKSSLYKTHLESNELILDLQKAMQVTRTALLALKTGGANIREEGTPPKIGLKNLHFFKERASDARKRREEEAQKN